MAHFGYVLTENAKTAHFKREKQLGHFGNPIYVSTYKKDGHKTCPLVRALVRPLVRPPVRALVRESYSRVLRLNLNYFSCLLMTN